MKVILSCLLLAASCSLRAQSYNVALIPDSLKRDARAVMRDQEYILEVKSPEKAVMKERSCFYYFK
jgi:hypothetical protein